MLARVRWRSRPLLRSRMPGGWQLQRSAAEAREQAMSQRIAEVSHELRTPLTHILGFSEMIERADLRARSARAMWSTRG